MENNATYFKKINPLPGLLESMKEELETKQSEEAAWKIIDEYFSFFGVEGAKKEAWVLTKGTLTNDLMDESENGTRRHDLIFSCEFLQLFFDAVHAIQIKRAGSYVISAICK